MKSIIYKIVGLAVISVTLISCMSDEEFLTKSNPNAITIAKFWKTEPDVNKGIMAIYSVLQYPSVQGVSAVISTRSDLSVSNQWSTSGNGFSSMEYNDSYSAIQELWADLYVGVFRANQAIANIPKSDIVAAKKTLYLGEARFLRALHYFWIANSFNNGEVVVHTEPAESVNSFYKGLASHDSVYSLIISDLKAAQSVLPETWQDEEKGRATWGAATAILGKVYLYEKNYAAAKIEFEKLIERKDLYQLTADISWNFDLEHEHNTESIFEVNFSDVVKPGTSGGVHEQQNGSEASNRTRGFAPSPYNGFRVGMPSAYLVELYLNDPIDPSSTVNGGSVYSARTQTSIAFPESGLDFYQKPTAINNAETPAGLWHGGQIPTQSYVKKFQNWKNSSESLFSRSGINERIIRLADVYLMYAEIVLELEGNVGIASNYINMVRNRAGVLPVEKLYPVLTSKILLDHLFKVERPLELSFEGHFIRWGDLVRKTRVADQFDSISKIVWSDINNRYKVIGYKEAVSAAMNYNTKIHDYFPIPSNEVLNNYALRNGN